MQGQKSLHLTCAVEGFLGKIRDLRAVFDQIFTDKITLRVRNIVVAENVKYQ